MFTLVRGRLPSYIAPVLDPILFSPLEGAIVMPRKVRDANLETRTARSRLKTRHKPYFRLIEPGVHLGYRKLPSGPERLEVIGSHFRRLG